jgi:ornithine carbamoyltransferase
VIGQDAPVEDLRFADGLEARDEDVVDVVIRGGRQARQGQAAHVEIAAKDKWRPGRPACHGNPGPLCVATGGGVVVHGGVEVAHPQLPPSCQQPHSVKTAALGPPAQQQRPVLGDGKISAAHEHGVRSAAGRLDRIGPPDRQCPAQRQQLVARGQDTLVLRPAAKLDGKRLRPPGRYLLQERHIPFPTGQCGGELIQEVAARRWLRAAVHQIPGENTQPHCRRQRTLPDLPDHFLTGSELSESTLHALLDRAAELKRAPLESDPLRKRTVALIFDQPSTRTRVSFEVGIAELGGHPMVLRSDDLQRSRGESIRDTAYVLSRHVAAICIRTGQDELVREFARHATVPVINMMTSGHHPCQCLADLLTLQEEFGELQGLRLAYVGDGNNVARSLATLGSLAGVEVRVASPPRHALSDPPPAAVLLEDPREAVSEADAVYTDVWLSMNDDPTWVQQRRRALSPYRLSEELLSLAASHAIAMHCLPAHPGEEITTEVLYGPRQRIWVQAENRRHVQKALLEHLIGKTIRSREPHTRSII